MADFKSAASADEMSFEKLSPPLIIRNEDADSSQVSIDEGELKRTHTFWSCTLKCTSPHKATFTDIGIHSAGISNNDTLDLELQHHIVRYNLYPGRSRGSDIWNVSSRRIVFLAKGLEYWLTRSKTAS